MSGATRMCLPPVFVFIVLYSGRPNRIDVMFGLAAAWQLSYKPCPAKRY